MLIRELVLVAFTVVSAERAAACSLAALEQPRLKAAVFDDVETSIRGRFPDVNAIYLAEGNVTDFSPFFPLGLGADCSGLEAAYSEASYFAVFYDPIQGQCRSTGTVKMNQYGYDGEVTVTALAETCGL